MSSSISWAMNHSLKQTGAWMLDFAGTSGRTKRGSKRSRPCRTVRWFSLPNRFLPPSCCWTKATSLPIAIRKKAGWRLIALLAGESDPSVIADFIQTELEQSMPHLNLKQRRVQDRFLHGEVLNVHQSLCGTSIIATSMRERWPPQRVH